MWGLGRFRLMAEPFLLLAIFSFFRRNQQPQKTKTMSDQAGDGEESRFSTGFPVQERPSITEKEVSWHEAVAAHLARKEAEAGAVHEDKIMLKMLRVPAVEKVNVAGLMLEPYCLAHSLLLEELGNPFEVSGTVSKVDIAIALMVFGEREFVESCMASYGPEKTAALLKKSPAVRTILAALNRASLPAITAWLNAQFGSISEAAGTTGEAEAEASVAAAEAARKKQEAEGL